MLHEAIILSQSERDLLVAGLDALGDACRRYGWSPNEVDVLRAALAWGVD